MTSLDLALLNDQGPKIDQTFSELPSPEASVRIPSISAPSVDVPKNIPGIVQSEIVPAESSKAPSTNESANRMFKTLLNLPEKAIHQFGKHTLIRVLLQIHGHCPAMLRHIHEGDAGWDVLCIIQDLTQPSVVNSFDEGSELLSTYLQVQTLGLDI